jgi:hypothetical protein
MTPTKRQIEELTVKEKAAFDRWYHAPDGTTEESAAYDEYKQYRDQIHDLVNPPRSPGAGTVVASYLTAAAIALSDPTITVDVSKDGLDTKYTCRGCKTEHSNFWQPGVQEKAQQHATQCTAMPKPEEQQ